MWGCFSLIYSRARRRGGREILFYSQESPRCTCSNTTSEKRLLHAPTTHMPLGTRDTPGVWRVYIGRSVISERGWRSSNLHSRGSSTPTLPCPICTPGPADSPSKAGKNLPFDLPYPLCSATRSLPSSCLPPYPACCSCHCPQLPGTSKATPALLQLDCT